MRVTEEDVRYVADLAHLDLTPEESARLLKDLDATLAYIDKLNEVDTTNVPPTAQVEPPRTESLRADETRPSLPRKEALGNAAETGAADGQPAFFKVPKVIER